MNYKQMNTKEQIVRAEKIYKDFAISFQILNEFMKENGGMSYGFNMRDDFLNHILNPLKLKLADEVLNDHG